MKNKKRQVEKPNPRQPKNLSRNPKSVVRSKAPDERHENSNKNVQTRSGFQNKNKSAYQKAVIDFKQKQQQKHLFKEEKARQQEEKKVAIEKYKQRKRERSVILSKKTKKGQPVMKDRMELLLKRVEQCVKVQRL